MSQHNLHQWGIDDDEDNDGKKARSGELVREDLWRVEEEDRKWRYRMVKCVNECGLGGVEGSELSEDYVIHRFCS